MATPPLYPTADGVPYPPAPTYAPYNGSSDGSSVQSFYPYATLPWPMTISNGVGSKALAFINLLEPPVLCEPQEDRVLKVHEMGSPLLNVRGNRVIQARQLSSSTTNPNWQNWSFVAGMLLPDHVARIRQYADGSNPVVAGDPGYVLWWPGGLSAPDSNNPVVLGILAKDPQPEDYRFFGRTFQKVKIEIMVLGLSLAAASSGYGVFDFT